MAKPTWWYVLSFIIILSFNSHVVLICVHSFLQMFPLCFPRFFPRFFFMFFLYENLISHVVSPCFFPLTEPLGFLPPDCHGVGWRPRASESHRPLAALALRPSFWVNYDWCMTFLLDHNYLGYVFGWKSPTGGIYGNIQLKPTNGLICTCCLRVPKSGHVSDTYIHIYMYACIHIIIHIIYIYIYIYII